MHLIQEITSLKTEIFPENRSLEDDSSFCMMVPVQGTFVLLKASFIGGSSTTTTPKNTHTQTQTHTQKESFFFNYIVYIYIHIYSI